MQTKSRLSRLLLPLGLGIVLVLGGVGIWYSQQTVEPQFTKEGSLTFGEMDSLGAFQPITTIDIEIANGMLETARGLMFRKQMEEQQGMLFTFNQMEERSFWMKNTYIPLDIIYVDNKGKIVSIQADTQPLSEAQIPSNAPAQFVVEVNAGFCKRNGVQVGHYISVNKDRN